MTTVIERNEGHYKVHKLPYGIDYVWCPRCVFVECDCGERLVVLYGPCSDTQEVVLDPVPEVGREKLVDPLSMHRNDFLRFLVGEELPSKLHVVSSQIHRPQELVEHGHVA